MLKVFLKVKYLVIFSIFLVSLYSIFLTKKNLITYFNNGLSITKLKNELKNKERQKQKLEDRYFKFKNIPEYRKMIIKNKLFLKEQNERIILYESSN